MIRIEQVGFFIIGIIVIVFMWKLSSRNRPKLLRRKLQSSKAYLSKAYSSKTYLESLKISKNKTQSLR